MSQSKSNSLAPSPPPTILTVARIAGVAPSTVSRALRNHPRISESTRFRIQEIAQRLGYRQSPYLKTLMTHLRQSRSTHYVSTLAWVERSAGHHLWGKGRIEEAFFQGARARAESLGFVMEKFLLYKNGLSPDRLTKILTSRGIQGVLLPPAPCLIEDGTLPFHDKHFAIATVGFRMRGRPLPFSMNDQTRTAREAVLELIKKGYKRIGYATWGFIESIVENRFFAGYDCVFEETARHRRFPVFDLEGDPSGVRLRAWLKEWSFDAIVVPSLPFPLGDFYALAGIREPRELAVASLDWHEGETDFAGMRQNYELAGANAVDLVSAQIYRHEFGIPTHTKGVLSESLWMDGSSAVQISPIVTESTRRIASPVVEAKSTFGRPITARINIETVARVAGVATSTVSRAFEPNTRISDLTRQRVLRVAAEVGYVRNPQITKLMTNLRTKGTVPYLASIVWLERSYIHHTWREDFVKRQFFQGALARAESLGYALERIAIHADGLDLSQLQQQLKSRGIRGAVLTPCPHGPNQDLCPVDPQHFALASVGFRARFLPLHFSMNDQFATARKAHLALRSLGYQRVGFVTNRRLERLTDYRFSAGFLSCQLALPEQERVPILYQDDNDQDADTISRWRKHWRIDGLVFAGGETDPGRLLFLANAKSFNELGVSVMNRHDDTSEMAGMIQCHDLTGSNAIDLVISQMNRNEYGIPIIPKGILTQGKWIHGPSAPPR